VHHARRAGPVGRSSTSFALAHISMCTTSEVRSESRTTYKKQRFAQILVSIAYSLNDMGMRRQAVFVLCVQACVKQTKQKWLADDISLRHLLTRLHCIRAESPVRWSWFERLAFFHLHRYSGLYVQPTLATHCNSCPHELAARMYFCETVIDLQPSAGGSRHAKHRQRNTQSWRAKRMQCRPGLYSLAVHHRLWQPDARRISKAYFTRGGLRSSSRRQRL